MESKGVHTTHPATPPAMPERITWSADLNFDASEVIRVQYTYAVGRWGRQEI